MQIEINFIINKKDVEGYFGPIKIDQVFPDVPIFLRKKGLSVTTTNNYAKNVSNST